MRADGSLRSLSLSYNLLVRDRWKMWRWKWMRTLNRAKPRTVGVKSAAAETIAHHVMSSPLDHEATTARSPTPTTIADQDKATRMAGMVLVVGIGIMDAFDMEMIGGMEVGRAGDLRSEVQTKLFMRGRQLEIDKRGV